MDVNYNSIKFIFASILLLVLLSVLKAETYTYETAGNWNEESNGDTYPGTTIDVGDEIMVLVDLTINTSVTINGSIEISDGVTFTNDWFSDIQGSMINNGYVLNNTQLNLFGDYTSNGTWENTEIGISIVTATGDFSCYGTFTNNGSLLGYNASKFYLEANFYNNDSFTFSGQFDINHSNGQEFINDGFLQLNGTLRLEGIIINQEGNNFNVNPSCTLLISDNSKVENYGTINVQGTMDMSILINAESTLGHVSVTGDLTIKPSILEIL